MAELSAGRAGGIADLGLAVRAGRTRLVRCHTRPPLFVQRALYVDEAVPDLAVIYLANPTAGLLAGDHLEIAVQVNPGARARVTTQAATKVYAMPEGMASQATRIIVDANAYLEYLPDPVIPFHDARFAQHTTIALAPTGSLIYSDILAPGRVAMGEALAYSWLDSRLTAETLDGRILYHEAACLAPKIGRLTSIGVLGRREHPSLGSFLVFSGQMSPGAVHDALCSALVDTSDSHVGIAVAPGGGGIVVKILARETAMVQAALRVAWEVARQAILGVPLPPVRKY